MNRQRRAPVPVERPRGFAHSDGVMRRGPILVLLSLATACVPASPPPPPAPAAPPPALPPPPAPLASDWRDWPPTPGTWSYARDARSTNALFGTPGSDPQVALRCDLATRQVSLSRAGADVAPVTIRTSSTTRALAVTPTGVTPPSVAATLTATDPLLDAIAFSRGRFIVEQAGSAPLVIPTYAEIGRVIEDCRG